MNYKLIFLLLFSPLMSWADEGMWMINDLPDAIYDRMVSYGFSLPKTSLYGDDGSVADKVVMFSGGCTGVLVSEEGLVLTNHHCGFDAIRQHSTVDNDIMLNGFVAKSREEELANTSSTYVVFMKEQRDVTSLLRSCGIDTLNSDERSVLIDSIEQIMTDSVSAINKYYYVNIDAFYEGNAYYATTYVIYNDVRLVMTLPKSMGKFGGETDNWMWPRQTCDFSLFRIYVDPITGEPADYSNKNVPYGTAIADSVKNKRGYMHVSLDGYVPGDFAMTIGYPGSTERYMSSYGIQQMRDCVNEPMYKVREEKQKVMKKHMDQSEEVRIKYDTKYAHSSNYWKNAIGMNLCIDSLNLVAQKQEFEEKLFHWLDTAQIEDYTRQQLAPLNKDTLRALYERRHDALLAYTLFMETFSARSNNELATRAFKYNNGMQVHGPENNPRKQYTMFEDNSGTWDRDLDVEALAVMMQNYRKLVPQQYLPDFYEVIDKQYKGDYQAYVEDVWEKSMLMCSGEKLPVYQTKKTKRDIGVQMSMSLLLTYADIKNEISETKEQLKEQERLLCAAKLRMEMDQPHYSDANFTMRLSYGQVGGYTSGGKESGYYTTPQSMIDKINLYERDSALSVNPYEDYFAEPIFKDILEGYELEGAKSLSSDAKDRPAALCFLTNNDITGGNSGSPVINGRGELIGLAFDGTWESLSSDIYYDSTLARCISVDIRYVMYMIAHWGYTSGGMRLVYEMIKK